MITIRFHYDSDQPFWQGFNYQRHFGLWLSLGPVSIDHYPNAKMWQLYFWRFCVSIQRGS